LREIFYLGLYICLVRCGLFRRSLFGCCAREFDLSRNSIPYDRSISRKPVLLLDLRPVGEKIARYISNDNEWNEGDYEDYKENSISKMQSKS
jgi:hypothetical protein